MTGRKDKHMNIIKKTVVMRNTLNESLTIDELFEKLSAFECFCISINYSGFNAWTDFLYGIVKESEGFYFDSGEVRIKTIQDAFTVLDDVFWVDISDEIGLEIICIE